MNFINDFLQGQKDCRDGVPHQPGKGDIYDRGYAAQYESEQLMTAMTSNTQRFAELDTLDLFSV